MKVIVTGSCRTGSSFVTNLIHVISGYNTGETKTGDGNNKWGYWENIDLNSIDRQFQRSVNAVWTNSMPVPPVDYDSEIAKLTMDKLTKYINNKNIELYKSNTLMMTPELYSNMFPDALWIYTHRNIDQSWKSRQKFGGNITKEEYTSRVNKRINAWKSSPLSKNALWVNYENFESDLIGSIEKIAEFLGIANYDKESAINVFKSKNKR